MEHSPRTWSVISGSLRFSQPKKMLVAVIEVIRKPQKERKVALSTRISGFL